MGTEESLWLTLKKIASYISKMKVLVIHSCLTLCNPRDCSPTGSSDHGILQARILKWVAIPFSRDLPHPGIEPRPPYLRADSLSSEPPGKPYIKKKWLIIRDGIYQGFVCTKHTYLMMIPSINLGRKMLVFIPYWWENKSVASLNNMTKFPQVIISKENISQIFFIQVRHFKVINT